MSQSDTSCPATFQAETEHTLSNISIWSPAITKQRLENFHRSGANLLVRAEFSSPNYIDRRISHHAVYINKICPALPVMVNIKLCEDCQSESDGDASGGACVRCTGCENLIHKYALRVKAVTLCSQCKRWSAPEDRSSPISHSSAPVSRISSPSSSQFTCSTEHSASLESLSLKRPRDSPPTAFCVKRTYIQLSESVPPVSPCQPGPPSEMSDDSTPPPWVSTLLSRFDRLESSMNGRLASIEASLLEFSRTQHQHTASIEHNTNSIAGLDGRVTAEIATIRSDNDRAFTAMRAEIGRACVQSRAAAAAAPVADHDTCEVRVSGIPLSVDVTSSATAERIVSALELDRLRPHILSVREWAPRRRTPVAAPSTSNAVLDLEMKTMVIRFSSANARETFLAAAPKFQRLSTHAIFGIADDGRPNHLRANVILPSDRHRLYRRCAAAAEAHGYPRPFVRNLCIYMRRARDSAPICIMSDDDLALLVSRPNETVTSSRWRLRVQALYEDNSYSISGLSMWSCFSPWLLKSLPVIESTDCCCAALLSGASATASEIRRGRRAKDIARTRLESRSTKLDALRCVDEGDTAAEHIETRDTGPPSTMPVTNESILEAILRIEAGVSEVRTTCTELKAGAVAMDAKLDKAIATLDVYDGRISAVEERQREIVGYMKRMKPCRAEDTINDVDSVRWLNPTASRRAAGGGAAAVPPTSRTLVVEYKQSITRDRVLSMKERGWRDTCICTFAWSERCPEDV
ncbi:unnamed protein product [Trichogramma brassicae]|uniref:Uncharacterized protein n=1 Tax=Trichogramma brassicae TaxID=86971 RepID=A0A6H5II11_9HYME|nr:unnamed protein product [Trichogramma brassicae]